MSIASVDEQGRPSLRMVLLKGYDERGFIFYTNYDSRKGRQLQQNGHAALCLYWEPLQRQVTFPTKQCYPYWGIVSQDEKLVRNTIQAFFINREMR